VECVDLFISPEVAAVRALYTPIERYAGRDLTIRDQLAAQAARLLEAQRASDPAARFQIACWHPARVGRPEHELLADPFTEDDARLTLAREHGFAHWRAVEIEGRAPPDAAFEDAVDATLAGDLERLASLLEASPQLVSQRSAYGHRAALIHYVAANGVETYRQVVPRNADRVLALLIGAGADVNAMAPIYGGIAPLELLLTSAHPRGAGLVDAMAAALKAAGATE
jgi:hypothetical protein